MPRKNRFDTLPDEVDQLEGTATTLARAASHEIIPDTPLKYDYNKVDERVREEVRYRVIDGKRRSERMTADIHEFGKDLLAIKELVPHGQFLEICIIEFEISERLAQNWMNVARHFEPGQVPLFSDTGALYMLAGPSVSEETRSRVIADAVATGQSISRGAARSAIQQQRAAEAAANGNEPAGGTTTSTSTTTRQRTYTPGQSTVTRTTVTTVDAGTGEIEQTDPLEGHIAVLKAAIDTAMWFAKQYNDDFNADRLIAGATSMISRLEADS